MLYYPKKALDRDTCIIYANLQIPVYYGVRVLSKNSMLKLAEISIYRQNLYKRYVHFFGCGPLQFCFEHGSCLVYVKKH